MARIDIKEQYLPFVAELMTICRQNDVVLSEHSAGLLYLATEAWFEDPELLRSVMGSNSDRRKLAKRSSARLILILTSRLSVTAAGPFRSARCWCRWPTRGGRLRGRSRTKGSDEQRRLGGPVER